LVEKHREMTSVGTHLTSGSDHVELVTTGVRVQVTLRPFSFTLRRRDGRSLLRAGGAWLADGEARDVFLQFTEGVVPAEQRAPALRGLYAVVRHHDQTTLLLELGMDAGRAGHLRIECVSEERVSLTFEGGGGPLRLGLDWERRSSEALVGLGLRHHPHFD
jgi:hypothetical protein